VSTVERTIRGDADGVQEIVQMVDGLAAAHDLPSAPVADMQVALDEVLVNIISYGHADGTTHAIRVRLTVSPEALEAEVEDDGRPFDPLAVAGPDLQTPLPERRVGGLGIHFVRRLMSEVRYARVDDRNRLVLRRRLSDSTEADTRGSS